MEDARNAPRQHEISSATYTVAQKAASPGACARYRMTEQHPATIVTTGSPTHRLLRGKAEETYAFAWPR